MPDSAPIPIPTTLPGATNTKSVATEHAEYKAMAPKWRRCRDAAAGTDALAKRPLAYLPKLTDQSMDDYTAYFTRAVYFNATWRTIAGLAGMLFRKPEQLECPDALKPLLADVTLANEPLHAFAHSLAIECFEVGRVGVLVDYPMLTDGIVTVAQARAHNLRPTLARYKAETIINWKVEPVNNVATLTQVVLTEDTALPQGEFGQACETRYRVLDLVPDGDGDLAYRVRVFRINKDTDRQEQVGGDVFPLMNGKNLDAIPFYFLGVDNLTPKVCAPPLVDLVDLNLAHFRVSADFEHGCHFTALPTAVVSGYQPTVQNEKLYIGSTSAWVFADPSAHATFLEFSGSGLGMLQTNLAHKEQQMAALGARLLNPDNAPNETATAAAIHHGGETSILAAVAQTLSLGLTRALGTFSAWAGLGPADGSPTDGGKTGITYQINRDFVPEPMDPMKLTALVAAWQAGAISFATLFANLKDGEIIDNDATVESEQAAIKAHPAPAPSAAAPPPTLADGSPNPAAQLPEPKPTPGEAA